MAAKEKAGNAAQGRLFGDDPETTSKAEGSGPVTSPVGETAEPTVPLLVLVDGHALAYRSYFALKQLSTSRGVPTNALYGFTRAILERLRSLRSEDRIAVAFDTPGPTFRDEAYEEYKAGRAAMPDDLPAQLGLIKELLDLLGVPRVEAGGVEADDVIATLTTAGLKDGYAVEIITSDRDALQLVGEKVRVRSPVSSELIGPEQVVERHGVKPEQWVDYRALTGDASDNLPGVPGIGPVTARALLNEYGTVDELLQNIGDVQPKRSRKLLTEHKESLLLSRELSQLLHYVELTREPKELVVTPRPRGELKEFLSAVEFGSILRELGLTEALAYAEGEFTRLQGEVLRLQESASEDGAAWAYGYVLDGERATAADVTELAVALKGEVGTATPPLTARLEGVVNAVDAKALVVAARSAGSGEASLTPGDDPLLMAYLLDLPTGSPEALARRLGTGEWGADASSRAEVGAELIKLLKPQLTGSQLRIYLEIERPLQAVLVEMELAGIGLDLEVLGQLTSDAATSLTRLEAELRGIAEVDDFNVNSRDQVAWLLFEKLGLRASRRTSTGKLSTAVSALEPLMGQHPAVDLILEYRELAKLTNTYLEPLAGLVDESGRIHTTFQQAVVATGRLSSVNPNLQAIPVRTALGREIRRAFVPSAGFTLLVADYSQIELRVLAHLATEPVLVDAFHAGEDIHATTAAGIYGVEVAEVLPEMRRVGKTINFGVLYGMGPQRLARDIGVPYSQAEAFIATYFARYPQVKRYIDETIEAGRERGYVETLLGRRRAMIELRSGDRGTREAAERAAFNMPVQGSAADIMKLAMLRLAPAFTELGGRLLLQIHDEIVAEVPAAAAQEATEVVRELMSTTYPLSVPLEVSVGVGPNWLEAS